jgi:hypothetical protein
MILREREWEVVDRFHLTQVSDWWRDVVNTVKNFQDPQKKGNFFIS